MKLLTTVLLLVFAGLQYKLWFEEGNVVHAMQLKETIAEQQQANLVLREQNEGIAAEIVDLKQGYAAIENRARRELGMIKEGEVFYRIVD